jgi:hypothetical protein
MPMQDPDDVLVAVFKHHANPNEAKSLAAGRLICDDMEVCEIRAPGSKSTRVVVPALSFARWVVDPETGGQVKQTYAERFAPQYRQFKAQQSQTKSGTPLTHAPFLTEARRAELRALNVYTVEALAQLDGQELKNIGPGGREMKNAAAEFIETSKRTAPNLQLQAELEALKARNAILEDDLAAAKNGALDNEFDGMSLDQLRDYITANTGHAPHGSYQRKQLLRMAMEARPEKAVA